MPIDFYYFFRYLQDVSFFSIVVPFLIIFVVIYALLEKTSILGKSTGSGVSVLIALLLSSVAIVNTRLVEFMNIYLGNFIIMIILFAVTLLAFMAITKIPSTGLKVSAVVLGILSTVWVLIEAQFYGPYGDFVGFFNIFSYWFRPYMGDLFTIAAVVITIWLIVVNLKRARIVPKDY